MLFDYEVNIHATDDEIEQDYRRLHDEYGDAMPLWSDYLEFRKTEIKEEIQKQKIHGNRMHK